MWQCGTHTCMQAYLSVSFLFILWRVACTIHGQRTHNYTLELCTFSLKWLFNFYFSQWLRAKWMNAFSLCACRVCVAVIYSLAFWPPEHLVIISLGAFLVHSMYAFAKEITNKYQKQQQRQQQSVNCNSLHCLPHIAIYNTLTKQFKQTNKQTKQFRIRLQQWMCRRLPPAAVFFIPFHTNFIASGFVAIFQCIHILCLLLSPYFLMFLPHRELTAFFRLSFATSGFFSHPFFLKSHPHSDGKEEISFENSNVISKYWIVSIVIGL